MLLALETSKPQQSKAQDDDSILTSSEYLQQTSEERKVSVTSQEAIVGIGKNTKAYKMSSLKQLPYFDALLSERWKEQHGNIIQIFDEYQGIGMDDLTLLLKCIELNHIPKDISLDLKQLESLVNCCDYFCAANNNESNMNNVSVINKRKFNPPITLPQRKQWLIDCENRLIRAALVQYDELLQNRLATVHGRSMVDETKLAKVSVDSNIEYDSNTAAALFKKNFDISVDFKNGAGGTDVVIEINNFEKELWTHLKKLFNI